MLTREGLRFGGGLYGSRPLAVLAQSGGELILGDAFRPAGAGLDRFGNVVEAAADIALQPLLILAQTQCGASGREGEAATAVAVRVAGTGVLLSGGVPATVIVLA